LNTSFQQLIKHIALRLLFFTTVIFGLVAPQCRATASDEVSARTLSEAFLQAEFEGGMDQRTTLYDRVKMVPNSGNNIDYVITCENDPVILITNFRIAKITIHAMSALVEVRANVIGKTVTISLGRVKAVRLKKTADNFQLHLIKIGDKWWIKNPPTPRMSPLAVVERLKTLSIDDRSKSQSFAYSSNQLAYSTYVENLRIQIEGLLKQ